MRLHPFSDVASQVTQRVDTTASKIEDETEAVAATARNVMNQLTGYATGSMDDATHQVRMARIKFDGAVDVWALAGALACCLLAIMLGDKIGTMAAKLRR